MLPILLLPETRTLCEVYNWLLPKASEHEWQSRWWAHLIQKGGKRARLNWRGAARQNGSTHRSCTFKGSETEPLPVPLKIEPTYRWCGRVQSWHIWQEFSPCFFTYLFLPACLSLDCPIASVQSSVSSSPSILSTTAVSHTWIRIGRKVSHQHSLIREGSSPKGEGKGTYTYTFSYNFKS